jgi:hypothetical protein
VGVATPPWGIWKLFGLAESIKVLIPPFGGMTVTEIVVDALNVPELPTMVIG